MIGTGKAMGLDTKGRSEEISKKCRCLKELFKERSFPDHFAFTHRIGQVESANIDDSDMADVLIGNLYRDLMKAPDGEGSVILNMERHRKYFPNE